MGRRRERLRGGKRSKEEKEERRLIKRRKRKEEVEGGWRLKSILLLACILSQWYDTKLLPDVFRIIFVPVFFFHSEIILLLVFFSLVGIVI